MFSTISEVEQDFERLTEVSMLFHGSDWEAQEGRFTDGDINYSHKVAYWFERYSDVVLAKALLKGMDEDYTVLFDSVMEQWIITSTYATVTWR
jgi:hypothetical protein